MVLQKLLRAGEGKIVRRLSRIADHVETLEGDVLDLTDAELRARTDQFKERYTDGESLDDLLPDAFATVREAAKRTLGQRHYKVQLMGGAAMHLGNVAEMRTGEGKTLAATLPAYLNSLSSDGVHVVTTNDYLVQRDAEWMGRVHRFLGLEVGIVLANERPAHRRTQYGCDITYGTNNEFGFDYLRDNMAWSAEGLVQRGHNFAIVDEVDSILIDEARTPLIISGPAEQSAKWYAEFARIAPILKRDRHYEVEEGKRTVAITEDGVSMVEDQLGIENLYEAVNTPLIGYLNNALKAKEIFRKDRDYIVTEGEVLIVDEFTGRVLSGRRYNEGLHQAIEAKEKVTIKDENQTLATITLQNYFRLYERLGGMTGTASTEAAELQQTYGLGVVPIPTNKDMIRNDQADIIYKTESAKFDSVVDDITDRHAAGQPILVGTASVEKSELLSKLLRRAGVPHEVLNAKNHAREAAIIAMAGRTGSVTVATNMAGRGTDIVLGGNPEFLADLRLRQQDLTPTETPDEYEAAWDRTLEEAKEEVEVDHEDVVEAGGLYVLGTERHESRRIDNQLRGRAGRQGDPGESRFYLSLGDDLMVRANGAAIESMMDRLRMPDDVPIESKIVSRAIQSAQTQVEQQNFEIRKRVLKYDEVMNRQREVIYAERDKVLGGADLEDQVRHMLDDVVGAYITGATETGYAEEWDLEQLWTALGQLYPVGISLDDLIEEAGGDVAGVTAERLTEAVTEDIKAAYDTREEAVTPDLMRELERRVLLTVMDRKWREHLYEMDYLREGIHLRAMANRDPVVEYQREGYDMFATMLDGIQEEAVGFLFNVEVKTKEEAEAERRAAAEAAAAKQQTSSAAQQSNGAAPVTGTATKPVKAGSGAKAAAPAKAAAKAVPKNANRATRRKAGVRAGAGTGPATSASNGSGAPAAESPSASGPAKSTETARDKVPALAVKGLAEPKSVPLTYSAPTLDGGARKGGGAGAAKTATVSGTTTQSRNSPCACGSGKKFKHCHGARG